MSDPKNEDEDEDTKAILERRRAFMQKALAGIALVATAGACDDPKKKDALDIRPLGANDAEAAKTSTATVVEKPVEPKPQPCLEVEPPPPPPPQPCLSVRPDPPPRPCLTPMRPKKSR